jgi:hypothetical protein
MKVGEVIGVQSGVIEKFATVWGLQEGLKLQTTGESLNQAVLLNGRQLGIDYVFPCVRGLYQETFTTILKNVAWSIKLLVGNGQWFIFFFSFQQKRGYFASGGQWAGRRIPNQVL